MATTDPFWNSQTIRNILIATLSFMLVAMYNKISELETTVQQNFVWTVKIGAKVGVDVDVQGSSLPMNKNKVPDSHPLAAIAVKLRWSLEDLQGL